MLSRFAILAGCAAALIGCASRSSTSSTPAAAQPSAAGATSPTVRWTGNLNPTLQRTGQTAPSGQARAFGTVVLTVAESNAERTRARITLDAPVQNRILPWAILPGRCGAGSLPLIGHDLFPQIEVGNTGRGQLDTELPLTLPTSGSFHVNVYWQGQTLDQVMTCSNLRREGTR